MNDYTIEANKKGYFYTSTKVSFMRKNSDKKTQYRIE